MGFCLGSLRSVSLAAAASRVRLCRKQQASFARTGSSYAGAVIVAGPSSGTEIVIGKAFVARRVCVQREDARERIRSRRRSGALLRKLEVSAGVGSACVAERTVCRSSPLATAVTTGSVDDSIFVACTMVWR